MVTMPRVRAAGGAPRSVGSLVGVAKRHFVTAVVAAAVAACVLRVCVLRACVC